MSFPIKASLWLSRKPSKTPYSPRFVKKTAPPDDVLEIQTRSSPTKETFFADAHRRDAVKRKTLNLRRWLANILLYHLLESGLRRVRLPSGSSMAESRTLEALSDNISDFLWYSNNDLDTVDQTAFVAVYYASYLVPKGILDHEELYTADGVSVATRLFVVSYALAIKCFNDSHKTTLYKENHRLKANLTSASATFLEFGALEALGFKIFLQHGKWIQHLETILEWTVKRSTGIHMSIKSQITQLLAEAQSSMDMKQTPFARVGIPPSPDCIAKVHDQLLSGLGVGKN